MSIISKLFGKKELNTLPGDPVLVDMHSHLLPGIDDGSQSLEESLELVQAFADLGYKKLITTPHIMGDFYKNNPTIIKGKLNELKQAVAEKGIEIDIQAAAEYYLDENFGRMLDSKEDMLTFGENYILFETSYLSEPSHLDEMVFKIKARGYWPVLAHPERYQYLYTGFEKFQEIYDTGISFQLNINSILGYYSKQAEHFALKLIEHNMVNFIGTDCHNMKHIEALKRSREAKKYQELLRLPLLNNSLL